MADRWWPGGMNASWTWWILLLMGTALTSTELLAATTYPTPAPDRRYQLRGFPPRNQSVPDLLHPRAGWIYPLPPRDATTRMPEFVPDGPRPFVPEASILPSESNIVAYKGEPVLLPCTVQYLGTKMVSWKKVGSDHFLSVGSDMWHQDPNIKVIHYTWSPVISEWNLAFQQARLEDSGHYDCQVISTEKVVWRVQLTVIEKPVHEPVIHVEGQEFVESGHSVYLKCTATHGDESFVDLDWFKDGDKIESKLYPHVLITKFRFKDTMTIVSELMIASGSSHDSGTYLCRSSSNLIASLDINVLVADTSNVKRGTGSSHKQMADSSMDKNSAMFYQLLSQSAKLCLLLLINLLFRLSGLVT